MSVFGNQFVVQLVFFKTHTFLFFLISQSFNNGQANKREIQFNPSSYLFRLPDNLYTKLTGREEVEGRLFQPSYPHSLSVAVFVCEHDASINVLFNCFVSSSEPF